MDYIPKQNWGSVRKEKVASAVFYSVLFSILISPEILFTTHGHLTAVHAIKCVKRQVLKMHWSLKYKVVHKMQTLNFYIEEIIHNFKK